MKNKLICGAFILLSGCVDEITEGFNETCTSSCMIISGRFTTEDGTVGIAHLPLELDWGNTGMLGGTIRKIASEETDSNGYYSFSFSPREEELTRGNFSIEFGIREEHLIDEEYAYFGVPITKRDTVLERNYHIPSKAKIRLMISNLSDIVEPDYLSATILYEKDDFSKDIRVVSGRIDTRNNQVQSVTLNNEIPSVTFDAAGNQYTYVKVRKRKGQADETYLDSLIIPTNQEITYELTF